MAASLREHVECRGDQIIARAWPLGIDAGQQSSGHGGEDRGFDINRVFENGNDSIAREIAELMRLQREWYWFCHESPSLVFDSASRSLPATKCSLLPPIARHQSWRKCCIQDTRHHVGFAA